MYHHSDSNLFVAASAVLILKNNAVTSGGSVVDKEFSDHNDESSSNFLGGCKQTLIGEASAIEPCPNELPKNLREIRLQLWRYINGVPLLYSEEASSCFLLTAIKSFNWLAFGHNIKLFDMEKNKTHKFLVCQPSLILIAVRDTRSIQVRKLSTSVNENSDMVDDLPSFATLPRVINVPTSGSIKGLIHADVISHYDCDHKTRSREDIRSKRQKSDHIVDDRACCETEDVDGEIVVRKYNSPSSNKKTTSHCVEARDLIVILDINTPDGKKFSNDYYDTCRTDFLNVVTVVSYVSVAKTGISGNNKAFQTAVNKGSLLTRMTNLI